MVGVLGFSILELFKKGKRAHWISQGLTTKNIQLSNGTSLHCWMLLQKKSSAPLSDCNKTSCRPFLLLLHSFGTDSLTGWNNQISALGKHFDLLIPDLIFFGDSTTTSSERSEIFQAECMKSMVEYLGVERVIVVGHSYGGLVAFWMAQKYPQLVRGLVLISSEIRTTPSAKDSLLKAFGASSIKDLVLPSDVKELKRIVNFTMYKMPWLPGFIYKELMQTIGKNREQRAELVDAMVIGSDNSDQPLPTVNQDVLIVCGDKDQVFTVEEASLLQRHIGENAKLVMIKECGHVPLMEKPTELNEKLLQFLLTKGK